MAAPLPARPILTSKKITVSMDVPEYLAILSGAISRTDDILFNRPLLAECLDYVDNLWKSWSAKTVQFDLGDTMKFVLDYPLSLSDSKAINVECRSSLQIEQLLSGMFQIIEEKLYDE